MYSELFEAIPLLISGNASWIKEHNRKQLAMSANYYERKGDKERAQEIRERIFRYI